MSILTAMMTGTELRTALEKAGMTQAELSRLIKRTPRHVNRWVKDDISIPVWVELIMLFLSQRPELKMFISDRIAFTRKKRNLNGCTQNAADNAES